MSSAPKKKSYLVTSLNLFVNASHYGAVIVDASALEVGCALVNPKFLVERDIM